MLISSFLSFSTAQTATTNVKSEKENDTSVADCSLGTVEMPTVCCG